MTDKNKILEKIKKCLALSASSNEHEAAAALRQAKKLMAEYKLTDDDIELSSISESSISSRTRYCPPYYITVLAAVICSAFNVKRFYVSGQGVEYTSYTFIGRSPADEVAAYTFDVLLKKCTQARTEFLKKNKRYKKTNRTRRANLFAEQWVYTVEKKIIVFAEQCPNTEKLIDKYISINHSSLVTANTKKNINERKRHRCVNCRLSISAGR